MNSTYPDLENNFPSSIDNIDKMSDLTTQTKPLADKYFEYMEAGNIDAANSYMQQYPSLAASIFNAKKFNALRDAIISVQRMFKNDIDSYIVAVSGGGMYEEHYDKNKTVRTSGGIVSYVAGIIKPLSDAISSLQSNYMGKTDYDKSGAVASSGGIVSYIDNKSKKYEFVSVNLSASNWGDSAPYTQTVSVSGMTSDWVPGIPVLNPGTNVSTENLKKQINAIGRISMITSGSGTLSFVALDAKPDVSLNLRIQGLAEKV